MYLFIIHDISTRTSRDRILSANSPSCSHQILGLNLARTHLPILGALFDLDDQFLLLILQLNSLAIKLSLGLLEGTLVFAQTLCGRHPLAKGPFNNLAEYISD